MHKHYNQLTRDQRSQISVLKSTGHSNKAIAIVLKVDRTTIGRELRRNRYHDGIYNHETAHKCAVARKKNAHSLLRKMTPQLIAIIEPLIRKDWSPVQISGWILKNHGIAISHERIYQYIWTDQKNGGTLFKHLRRKGKTCNYARNTKAAGRGHIPNRRDIKERPAIVETKSRLGDLEIDLIIGTNHQGAVLSCVDRSSKFTWLVKLPDKSSKLVTQAIIGILNTMNYAALTITCDNGLEFSGHEEVTRITGVPVYFATPYHSWERGLNEHTNGLVRQYLPKKSNLLSLKKL